MISWRDGDREHLHSSPDTGDCGLLQCRVMPLTGFIAYAGSWTFEVIVHAADKLLRHWQSWPQIGHRMGISEE